MIEIASLFNSAKAAYDIAKGISSLRSEVERNESVSKVQEMLLSLQQDALSMQEQLHLLVREKEDLTKKLIEFEQWSEVVSKYELKVR